MNKAVSTKSFTVDAHIQSMTVDFSDLGMDTFHVLPGTGVRAALLIESHKTGSNAWFYLDETMRDRDGDVTHWVFRPTLGTQEEFPNLQGWYVVVFND